LADKIQEDKGEKKSIKAETASSMDIAKTSVAEEAAKVEANVAVKPAGMVPIWPKDIKKAAIKAVLTVLILFLLTIIGFGVAIYGYKSESPMVKAFAQAIPYPAEIVNSRIATYYDYLFEVDANKRAYQNNAKLNNQPAVDFSSKDGKKLLTEIKQHAIDKLKSDLVTADLASKKKISVKDKDVDNMLSDLYKRYGGKDTLLKTVKKLYDWQLGDLRSVLRKQLLSQKLQEAVVNDPTMLATARLKADAIVKQLKNGADFAELAKKNSQSSDASTGGDLGTFTRSQLPTSLQKSVDAVAVGQISDPIKTDYGFEIVKVTSRDGDNIKAMHILIKTTDYTEYFNDQLKKAKVNFKIAV